GVPAAVAELGLADALAAAQRKISVTSGGRSGSPPPALVPLDMPRWFHGAEHVPHLPALASAVRERRRLRLGYRRGDDLSETTRVVSPLGLGNKAGVWYLVAVAAGRGEPVVFRVGRIVSARVLADMFARPSGFDLAAFWADWSALFEESRPKVEVRVRAAPAALA